MYSAVKKIYGQVCRTVQILIDIRLICIDAVNRNQNDLRVLWLKNLKIIKHWNMKT